MDRFPVSFDIPEGSAKREEDGTGQAGVHTPFLHTNHVALFKPAHSTREPKAITRKGVDSTSYGSN
jgi:hypothetical protein